VDYLRSILVRLHNEPVLLRSAVGAVVVLLGVFGLTVNDATLDPVIDVLAWAIAFAITASARSKVTPV
jgi:hypothetical protein